MSLYLLEIIKDQMKIERPLKAENESLKAEVKEVKKAMGKSAKKGDICNYRKGDSEWNRLV